MRRGRKARMSRKKGRLGGGGKGRYSMKSNGRERKARMRGEGRQE